MTNITGDWLTSDETQSALAILLGAGHQAFVVGGCVRNAVMGVAVADVDIATDAWPETVSELASAAGFHAVPTGIDHGTVTVVVNGTPFEITTYRRDISTDGRRAKVTYADDIATDAARRDFTMNALYADRSGKVHDPLDGLADAKARTVRFILDADARIREDYLRALRFFRFNAWYGDPRNGMDADALAAIAGNLDGLAGLSRERVGAEMLKLLAAPDPSPAVAAMEQTGVLHNILPGTDARFLSVLVHFERDITPDAVRRLAILGGDDPTGALRLSKADSRRWNLLRDQIGGTDGVDALGYRHGADAARDIALLRAAMMETPPDADFRQKAEYGAAQVLPVKAADLMPEHSGEKLGQALKAIEDRWIKSGFSLTRAQLLH